MAIYIPVFETLSEVVNKSQYFNPFFSWLIVSFTYFSIGIRGGAIWKYLFYAATLGFIATCCGITYTVSQKLNYFYYKYFVLLTWVEGICWSLNEWGYVYINFVKIRSCIASLRKKRWSVIMGITLIYSIVIRIQLMYLDYTQRLKRMEHPDEPDFLQEGQYEKRKDTAHGFLYLPLGLICASFIFFTFREFFIEKDEFSQNILTIVLHSTLSRMSLVSLLFIGLSIIVHLPSTGAWGFIRLLLWRIKGNLGLIFLIDILLLRIDLDHNQIAMQEQEIEKIKLEKDLKGVIPLKENRRNGDFSEYRMNNNYMFPSKYELENRSYTETEDISVTPDSLNHSYSNSDTYRLNTPNINIIPDNNLKNMNHLGNTSNSSSNNNNINTNTNNNNNRSHGSRQSILEKPKEAIINLQRIGRKFSHPNIYNDDKVLTPAQNIDRRYSVQSVLLGNKVYSKVPLSPSLSMTSKTAVSPASSYNINKISPVSPMNLSIPENEISIHQSPMKTNSAKKSPGNILIESNLL